MQLVFMCELCFPSDRKQTSSDSRPELSNINLHLVHRSQERIHIMRGRQMPKGEVLRERIRIPLYFRSSKLDRASEWQTAAAALRHCSCCRGPASLTLGPARTTRCLLRAGTEYLEGIPNRSFDPGAAAAKSQHRNHLGHDLVVSAQLLIGGQPPDQSHEIRRAALCD
jgi:hypothetical protein